MVVPYMYCMCGIQVNAISCSTCWKILLFMEYKEDRDDILKGVRALVIKVLPVNCLLLAGGYSETISC